MKKALSKIYKELGIDFVFPIEIKNSKGNLTYFENSDGYWILREYNEHGNMIYYETRNGYWWRSEYEGNNVTHYEDSNGDWWRCEYDAQGNETYFENSSGKKSGTPRASVANKVITVDGKQYKLTKV